MKFIIMQFSPRLLIRGALKHFVTKKNFFTVKGW
jgi:hypothetical protein